MNDEIKVSATRNRISQEDFDLIARAFPNQSKIIDNGANSNHLPIFNVRLRPSTIKRIWKLRKYSGLDTEWRIFNQLSRRMIRVYKQTVYNANSDEEWIARARLIVDYVSGLTDTHALHVYQNFMGISLGSQGR
jgi:hypothetical protein